MADLFNDDKKPFTIRGDGCRHCGIVDGYITTRNGQDCVFCERCNRFQYNAPRVETGREPRTVTTVHEGVKPGQRSRIIMRDQARCVFCSSKESLHVGHLLSVSVGLSMGLTEVQLNHDDNLVTTCAECNLGQGDEPIAPWIIAHVLRWRLRTLG